MSPAEFEVFAKLREVRKAAAEEASLPLRPLSSFRIFDPKPRTIHAPAFRDRVLHHVIMAHVGPILDRVLVDDTFACRAGKGLHKAVRRAQEHTRRFPWFVKADIRQFFASIDHDVLKSLLRRRLKSPGVLSLLDRVIDFYGTEPGRGLPIGALTSQHFANFYLAPLDRFVCETARVRGFVRYMDDAVWWCDSKEEAKRSLAAVRAFTADALRLEVRDDAIVQRSRCGLPFLGFRIYPGAVRLSKRRRQRYAAIRRRWETAYARGEIDGLKLQAGYAAAYGITAHSDSAAWRREQLRRVPAVDA